MLSDGELIWTVVETSPAGDTVVGLYTTLTGARDVVSRLAQDGRLEDYRIEGHSLDHGRDVDVPWQVHLARDGAHLSTLPFAGCNCADDEAEFRRRSFIEHDGEAMSVIVLAPTPGLAIAAAERYREWLLGHDLWAASRQLDPVQAPATSVSAP